MLVIRNDGKLLLSEGYDKIKNEHFYRFLGGSLNFGETFTEGIRREIREELKCEIVNLTFLDTIENIFIFEGEKRHQIVFLYQGGLSDKNIYEKPTIHIIENTYEFDAKWVSVQEILTENKHLYPEYDYSKILR